MDNLTYWQTRTLRTQEKLAKKTESDVKKQLVKYYRKSAERIIKDFEALYDKIQATKDAGKEPTPADLYRLDKYWEMQGQLQHELQRLGDKSMAYMQKRFLEQYMDVYKSVSLPSQVMFATMDKAQAQQLINSIWCADGKSWSERIWDNTKLLGEILNEELVHCVVTGKKTSELKKLLQEKFNTNHYCADRIARTEIAHINTQAAQQRYKDYGVKEVEVWADKDERRCEICGKLHKKRYPVDGRMPVPVHPNCRCTIIPVIE